MTGKVIRYFVCGHTARGFRNLSDQALAGMEHLFVLDSASPSSDSALIKAVGEELVRNGLDIEFLHNPLDAHEVDGVLIPSRKAGLVREPIAGGASALDCRTTRINLEEQAASSLVTDSVEEQRGLAYEAFAEALAIHDEWEKYYIHNMDFTKADELTDTLIIEWLGNRSSGKNSVIKHRFLGAATPSGSVDFVPLLTDDINQRYFIKGRPGSGKSTMLKKLAKQAELQGFDVEVYHCGFDPESLDMVILRELGIAVFDSTAPHEYFPSRTNDQIIDMYSSVITPGTDERYQNELEDIALCYKQKVSEATSFLSEAKKYYDHFLAETNSSCAHELDVMIEKIAEKIMNT
ncbi:hypothetical protein [Peribacillus kribbensis]|uniref:hypothetical protein n=1 Tax=Peribacillus kribbensis TaxID=356658 RepID=UPI0003FDD0EB|nr:hypothetical protein [Peribacillus kribbensis]